MKILRRLLIVVGLVGMLLCLIMLANITAPNPTGRRYSSTPINLGLDAQGKGQQGEAILAAALHLPNNNAPDQRKCFCNRQRPGGQCRICVAVEQLSSTYRRPDFFADRFVAEVKNVDGLLYDYTDQLGQIADYARGAKVLGVPLWLYVRTDSQLDPEFYSLVESTGGGVVHYLTVPGYVDPIDRATTYGLIIIGVIVVLMTAWELASRHVPVRNPAPKPNSRQPTLVDTAEDFIARAKNRAQRTIDTEDSRPQ